MRLILFRLWCWPVWLFCFLSPQSGLFNQVRRALGWESVNYMYEGKYFKTIYVLSGVWQNTGWGSIIYLSALAGSIRHCMRLR